MEGFIPTGGAGSTALVQSASGAAGNAAANVTATFAVPATVGNIVIAAFVKRGASSGSPATPSGWTRHDAEVITTFSDGGRMVIFYRTVPGGGLTGLTVASTDVKRLYIQEWSGLTAAVGTAGVGYSEVSATGSTTSKTTDPITPAVTNAVLFAGFVQAARTPSLAIQAPFSEDYDVDVDPSGPGAAFGHRIISPASGTYDATCTSSHSKSWGALLFAFSSSGGGITWVPSPASVDEADGTSDDVDDVAIANSGGAFWRGISGFASVESIRVVLGMDDPGDVSVLIQAGDASDWSDATTLFQADYTATGSFTADEIDITFDPLDHLYWRLVLDTTEQDIRVYEVTLAETVEAVPTPTGKAILEIYVHDEGASRWGTATWATGPATGTEGIWSGAGWQDVTPQGVNAHIIWGSRRPSRGILAEQSPASWNVQTYDPERILDPGNFDGPYYPQLVAGVPIRISHDSVVIRTGIVDEWHYKLKRPDYQGQILASDTWSLLNQAMVPADSILGDTLIERIADAINAAGVAVGGIPLPPPGPTGPTIAGWVEGVELDDPTSVGEHIRIATSEVLWVPFVQADAGLGLRSWGAPLDRGRVIAAPNLEDLEAVSHEDGLYSVVKVQVEDPDLDPIIRKAAPLPRYGERVWERREPTIDPEGYAAAILGERPWPGVQWVPGAIHCFTAADVDYFGTIEIMERVTLSVPGAVSVQGRVLGGELFVEHRKQASQGATWLFYFAVATDGSTAIGSTILVADETGETLLDDMTDTDFLEAD